MLPRANIVDNLVGLFSPRAKAERLKAKAQIANYDKYAVNYNSGFAAGDQTTRTMRGVMVDSNDPNADTVPKLNQSRALSRDMAMNAPLARAAINRTKNSVVGKGLTVQSRIDREFLGLTEDQAQQWEKDTERRFLSYSKNKDCDLRRQMDFYQLQGLVLHNVLLSGDAFVLYPAKRRQGISSDLRIQVIEGDLVSTPWWDNGIAATLDNTIGGVKTDSDGAPTDYFFTNYYEGSNYGNKIPEWVRVPAYGAQGRKNVHHLLFAERPGQRRGMPLLAPVLATLKNLSRLTESELQASIVSSFFTVFIKNMSGWSQGIEEGFVPPSVTTDTDGEKYPADKYNIELGPANVHLLDDDKEIQVADPKRQSDAFGPFFDSLAKQVSAGTDIPYEVLILHFSASYSASRAALLEAKKYFDGKTQWLIDNFCQVTYEEWLTMEVSTGRIQAPGFFESPENKAAWCKSKWTGQNTGQIDPLKETKAALLRVQNNLTSREDELNQMNGHDWDSTVERIARERDKLEELGLVTEIDSTDQAVNDPVNQRDADELDDDEEE